MRGALVILAIGAALFGAPRSAAAASNTLTPFAASPASGTTTTPFTLRAAYDGRFDALAVTASVAGRTLPMALAVGTASRGTWSVTTVLPAGDWSVTYRATTARGSAPVATGSTLSVAGIVPAAPPPAPSFGGGGPPLDEEGAGADPVTSPGSSGAAAPASAAPGATRATPAPAPASPATSPDPDGFIPGTGVHGTPTGGPATGAGSGSAPASPAVSATHGAGGAPTGGTAGDDEPADGRAIPTQGSATNDPDSAPQAADELVASVILFALVAVAGIAAGGTLFLLVTRRRPPRRLVVEVPVAARPRAATEPDRTSELLDRRALRRAHLVLEEDPIVASLVNGAAAPTSTPSTVKRPRTRPPRP